MAFRARKAFATFEKRAPTIFLKLRPAYSVKLDLSYLVKEIKIKRKAIFHTSRCLRFEDTKRIMSPELRPKSLGPFLESPETFRAQFG